MTSSRRYSAPFFFNPSYEAVVEPMGLKQGMKPAYKPIVWGEFRMQRFAGDYSDQGKEIQIEDFKL